MSRFFLAPEAHRDLNDILSYLDELPHEPGERIAHSLQAMLHSIGREPYLGTPQSHLTRLLGEEVRSRLVHPYRIFYRIGKHSPEVFAILHGARDQSSILDRRFQ